MNKKIRIGALISGGGTNLQAIINSCETGTINGEILFVGSDNPKAYGLKRAQKHNIPTFFVDYSEIIHRYKKNPESISVPKDLSLDDLLLKQTLLSNDSGPKKVKEFMVTRVAAEKMMLNKMEPYPFDLLVLAGFMRNLTPYFIDKINTVPDRPRIMNIHPALLPAFPGTDGYGDTFRYGCKVGGCTVHFIDYGEDSGPIIGQKAFQIDADDTLDSIRKKGLKLEWELYPECINLFAQKKLKTAKKQYTSKNGKTKYRTIVEIV